MTTRRFDFVTTIETSQAPIPVDPSNPNDPITLGFADDRYTQGQVGVADIAALKALVVADRRNRDLILVAAKNAVYRYDSASVAAGDDDRIVQPTAGAGRYFLVSPIESVSGNLTVPGALIVTGDLTVNGTTTTINTATLNVEDANITVNDGGTQSTANTNVSGITIEMSDATDARIGYDSTLASRFKAGEVGTESQILTAATAQTIGGVKTFDAHTIHDELAVEPATPAAGYRTLFADSTGFKQKDSGGVVSGLGGAGGSGSGEINMIASGSLAADWVGTGAVTVETTTTSAELPLEGAISTAIKISAGAATQYAHYRFTMADGLKQAMLKIEWFQRVLSSFANDDFKVEMWTNAASDYSGAYTEVALNTDVTGDTNLKALDGVFRSSFFAAGEDYYELRIVRNAGTSVLSVANVIVGPGKNAQGAIVSEWVSYTGTGSWTNTTFNGRYRRIGDTMELQMLATCTGIPVGGSLTLSLPAGFTINTTALSIASPTFDNTVLGNGGLFDFGVDRYIGEARYSNTTSVGAWRSAALGAVAVTPTVPFTFGANDTVNLNVRVPISQWAGSGVVNLGENDVEYAWNSSTATGAGDTTSFAYGPQGAQIQNITAAFTRRVRFRTPINPTDQIRVEVSPDRITWVPASQGAVIGGNNLSGYQIQNTTAYGLGRYSFISSTDIDVAFAQYAFVGGSYGAVGSAWSLGVGSGFWRVVKHKAGIPVGFGQVTGSAAGLMPANFSNLDDVAATRMGLLIYSHGTTYAGGNAPTITLSGGGGTLSSVQYSQFIPYQMKNGSWRMKFTFNVTTSSLSRTFATFTIAGLGVGLANQPISASSDLTTTNFIRALYTTGGQVTFTHATATTAGYLFSGDVEIGAKPTWAY